MQCGRISFKKQLSRLIFKLIIPIFTTMINKIILKFEQHAFGVCEWWGKKLGIRSTTIRMYFIYLSFFTFGSPIIIYFIMAFMLEHKESFKFKQSRKKSVWDI